MKNFLFSVIIGLVSGSTFSQLKITLGTRWINSGAAVIILNDIDLINDGTMITGSSVMKFTGNGSNPIGGSSVSNFHELEMAKAGSNKVNLSNNISVSKRVLFTSGLMDLNGNNLTLSDIA